MAVVEEEIEEPSWQFRSFRFAGKRVHYNGFSVLYFRIFSKKRFCTIIVSALEFYLRIIHSYIRERKTKDVPGPKRRKVAMVTLPEHIFREYDIRGIAETELNPEVVCAIGKAYGTWLHREGVSKAVVGGDIRMSSPRIMENVTQGLQEVGVDVISLGRVTTPAFYWSMLHLECGGGVMVTGSHNPKEMNGLKLGIGKVTLYGKQIQEVLQIIKDEAFHKPSREGSQSSEETKPAYVDMLASKITLGPRRLKVVGDAGNGAASLMMSDFFGKLPCDFIPLFDTPDGTFPNHHPDPTVRENLVTLIDRVKKEKADFGVGFDGDSDRIGVVNDQGDVIWGDTLMALYWDEILNKNPGAEAIIEVKCSQALVDEVERLGGRPLFWKSGHSLIKAKMKEIGALFAGEVSGHMFFADEYYGFDDAFYAAGRLMRILSHTEEKLSDMVARIPKYYSTAETRFACPDDTKFQVVEKVKDGALKDYEAVTVDGVRILYPNGWGLLRASNTQPVLVARVEGRTEQDFERYREDLHRRIVQAGAEPFEWTY